MKIERQIIVILLIGIIGCESKKIELTNSESMEVRQEVGEVMKGLNNAAAEKDINAFMNYWWQSDSLVYSRNGKTFLGWDEVKSDHTQAFSSPETWKAEMKEIYIKEINATTGVGTAFNLLSSPMPDSSFRSSWFIMTATIQKMNDSWKVIHAHSSYSQPGTTPRP